MRLQINFKIASTYKVIAQESETLKKKIPQSKKFDRTSTTA